MWIRLWTLEEAKAALPEVRIQLAAAREAHQALKDAHADVRDLEIVWGDQIKEPTCKDHGEYRLRKAEMDALHLRLQTRLQWFKETGVEVKDLEMGLIDFHALNGDRLVYLCYLADEEDLQAWHTLQGGFSGRKPLPEFDTGSGR